MTEYYPLYWNNKYRYRDPYSRSCDSEKSIVLDRYFAPRNEYTEGKGGHDEFRKYELGRFASEPGKVVEALAGERLRFQFLSREQIKYLLASRKQLRDKNHMEIMSKITDISGKLSGCLRTYMGLLAPELSRTIMGLERIKNDLESDLRQEDLIFWKDTTDLYRALLEAEQEYRASRRRAGLFSWNPEYDG